MEVRLYRQDQDLVAQVRLTNTGSSPLNVDRDLVLLLEVHPLSANLQRTGEDSPAAGQPERITALQPGESVEREINLSRGFAHFMGGLMHINYGDYSTWGHYGEEEAWWMAPGAVPTGIEVRYHDPDDGLMGAISEFMDVPYEDLGLYEGPLHVLIQTD